MHPTIASLEKLWIVWADLGEKLSPEDFDRPSLCSEWSVKEVFAHHSQAVHRLGEFAGSPTDLPVEHHNATSFFNQFNLRPEDAGQVRDMAIQEAADATISELVSVFRDEGPLAIRKADEAGEVNLQTDEGRINIYHYVETRITEAVMHLIDVYRPLGLEPEIPQEGLDITANVLLNFMDRVEFIEASTGRSDKQLFPVFW